MTCSSRFESTSTVTVLAILEDEDGNRFSPGGEHLLRFAYLSDQSLTLSPLSTEAEEIPSDTGNL